MTRNIFIAFFILASCTSHRYTPKEPFSSFPVPIKPDYSLLTSWASHPELHDPADSVPDPSVSDNQGRAIADVFFIHPTTLNSKEFWNAWITDPVVNEKTANGTIRHQASIFNSAGRIYCPRYRQATLGSFWTTDKVSAKAAIELAYTDVKAAFEYYLEHYNKGRPILIAAHSQGSLHATWLLKEFFDGKPLSSSLVAAYIVGWPVMPENFSTLNPCREPGSTGCYVSWSTFAWGAEDENGFHNGAVVVNPISWNMDTTAADISQHKGLVLRKYDSILPEMVSAKIHGGVLWVTKPDVPGKFLIRTKNYHVADYNIFWQDVRENAAQRVQIWAK